MEEENKIIKKNRYFKKKKNRNVKSDVYPIFIFYVQMLVALFFKIIKKK